MLLIKFVTESQNKEEAKLIVKNIMKKTSRFVKSFSIVSNEQIVFGEKRCFLTSCEITMLPFFNYESAEQFLSALYKKWEWEINSAHTSRVNMNPTFIVDELYFINCSFNTNEVSVTLNLMCKSEEHAKELAERLFRMQKEIKDYSILHCSEYWKIDGCYEVSGLIKLIRPMTLLQLHNFLTKWSDNWSFIGLQSHSIVEIPGTIFTESKIQHITCWFKEGIEFH